jgi:transcription elongation factor S-II
VFDTAIAASCPGKEYASKYRQLTFNLKKNVVLAARVLFGEVLPDALVRMTAEELADEELQRKRQEWMEKKARERQTDQEESTTDMFRCGRCGERRCTYFQKQTRSADEPMTTFVRCVKCGNRWKF